MSGPKCAAALPNRLDSTIGSILLRAGAPFAIYSLEAPILFGGQIMSSMTKKMSQAGSGNPVMKKGMPETPKVGDRFRCQGCGMEIQLTADCGCSDSSHVQFRCCNQEMRKV
jgi:hypothetical protein